MLKKIIALIITICLISSLSVFNASAVEIATEIVVLENYEQYNSTSSNFSEKSSVNLNTLRNRLFNAIYNGEQSVSVLDFNIKTQEVSIISNVMNNMPEILNAVDGFQYSYYTSGPLSGIIDDIYFYYNCNKATFQQMYNDFENAATQMTADLINCNLTNVQKLLVLHDRLALKCEYSTYKLQNNLLTFKEYSAYGALVMGDAVCQGYAEAYQYLLEKIGIESILCNSQEINHVWNIVYINGNSYHIDVTWDDPVFNNPYSKPDGYVQHTNFLLSSDALFNNYKDGNDVGSHISYDYITEPQDTFFDNFFWREFTTAFSYQNGKMYYSNLKIFKEKDLIISNGFGDVNGDGDINAVDITSCRNLIYSENIGNIAGFRAFDVNSDSEINVLDIIRFKRLISYLG